MSKEIYELSISVRTYNALQKNGIFTVDQLTAMTRKELLNVPMIGPTALREIECALSDYNGERI
jgi:DNA-directed RNA polymerase alpha subunit